MEILSFVLYFVFFICEALAAFNVPFSKVSVGWLGLMFFALALLLGAVVPFSARLH